MGVALTDTLIELANPLTRRRFKENPEAFLADRGLTPDEKDALAAGTFATLFPLAQSTASNDPLQQFNRFARPKDLLLVEEVVAELVVENVSTNVVENVVTEVHELDVHIHVEHDEQVCIAKLGSLVVDEEGRIFMVRPKSRQ